MIPVKSFFFILLVGMLVLVPFASADSQGIVQNGIGNSAYQVGGDAYIHVNKAFVKETNTMYQSNHNSVTFEAPEAGPQTSFLGIGDVEYTRLIYPNRIAVIPIGDAVNLSSVRVRAGTPVALYTVSSEYYNIVYGEQATPVYNEYYDRMDHGTASWESWIPYYTTSSEIEIPATADYLVIDNRNVFTSYNLVEIIPNVVEEKQSY